VRAARREVESERLVDANPTSRQANTDDRVQPAGEVRGGGVDDFRFNAVIVEEFASTAPRRRG